MNMLLMATNHLFLSTTQNLKQKSGSRVATILFLSSVFFSDKKPAPPLLICSVLDMFPCVFLLSSSPSTPPRPLYFQQRHVAHQGRRGALGHSRFGAGDQRVPVQDPRDHAQDDGDRVRAVHVPGVEMDGGCVVRENGRWGDRREEREAGGTVQWHAAVPSVASHTCVSLVIPHSNSLQISLIFYLPSSSCFHHPLPFTPTRPPA